LISVCPVRKPKIRLGRLFLEDVFALYQREQYRTRGGQGARERSSTAFTAAVLDNMIETLFWPAAGVV
ncbi:MAG TPA: hypothetical protein VJS37_15830, partial [Terriglobales bacterium]|nr:hypothetical protein [Terriglobales bacterium]